MRLIKGNVERITNDKARMEILMKEGFKPVEIEVSEKKADGLPENPSAPAIMDDMTLQELKEMAKGMGLEGYSSLSKRELLEVMKGTVNDQE